MYFQWETSGSRFGHTGAVRSPGMGCTEGGAAVARVGSSRGGAAGADSRVRWRRDGVGGERARERESAGKGRGEPRGLGEARRGEAAGSGLTKRASGVGIL